MFALHTARGPRHCDGLSRREWLRVGALGVGGLALPDLLRLQETAAAADPPERRPARARSVIVLFLSS